MWNNIYILLVKSESFNLYMEKCCTATLCPSVFSALKDFFLHLKRKSSHINILRIFHLLLTLKLFKKKSENHGSFFLFLHMLISGAIFSFNFYFLCSCFIRMSAFIKIHLCFFWIHKSIYLSLIKVCVPWEAKNYFQLSVLCFNKKNAKSFALIFQNNSQPNFESLCWIYSFELFFFIVNTDDQLHNCN